MPTLYQKVVGECVDLTSDLSIYQKNKDLFYNALVDMGYECVEPGGAFYLFPKALEEDANALGAALEEKYPEVEVEIHFGGQPIYYYVISVE